jgi:hypothetical protein
VSAHFDWFDAAVVVHFLSDSAVCRLHQHELPVSEDTLISLKILKTNGSKDDGKAAS